MDTHFLEPLTEDEMYTIEFHDCELHEDEPEEEAENGDDCRVEPVLRRSNPRRFTNRRTASSNTRSRFSGLATTIVSRVASAWKSPVWNAPFDLDIPPVRMRRRRAGRGTGSRTATRGRR